jgi:hypothetical protein
MFSTIFVRLGQFITGLGRIGLVKPGEDMLSDTGTG